MTYINFEKLLPLIFICQCFQRVDVDEGGFPTKALQMKELELSLPGSERAVTFP